MAETVTSLFGGHSFASARHQWHTCLAMTIQPDPAYNVGMPTIRRATRAAG
jgi:hypothetical protein